MAPLRFLLLGSVHAERNGQPLAGLGRGKVLALLTYLIIESGRPLPRDGVAQLIWPAASTERARHSLRQALVTLRDVLGEREGPGHMLRVNELSLEMVDDPGVWCDAREVIDLLDASDRHEHRRLASCPSCMRRAKRVLELYRGEFCAGFGMDDSEDFEDWIRLTRDGLSERVVRVCEALAAHHAERGEDGLAMTVARRWLRLEPWSERAHRMVMGLHWVRNDRAAALEQFVRCRQVLEEELGVEPEEATMALYERIRLGDRRDVDAGSLRRDHRAHNLPEQSTPLIGREDELERIAEMVSDPECRLVTLAGPGGIGKTRLAIEAARVEAPGFGDGAYFVPLAFASSSQAMVAAVASVLGVPAGGDADRAEHVVAWLRERELLLVLDNLEHLPDAAAWIARVLERAPAVQVLATSRERLHLRGEWIVEVGGLSTPIGDGRDGIDRFGAVRLLAEGLRRSGHPLPVSPDAQPLMAELCRLVEGTPLAIELAAAWFPVLSLEEIVGEVRASAGFLATTKADVPQQHRSMRAVFDRSWRLLAPEERAVFARLSVFRGGFLRAAAEHVAGANLPLLSRLMEKSLLRRDSGNRYTIHELLRQFGVEALAADPDDETRTRDRHSGQFLTLLRESEAALQGNLQDMALQYLNVEHENIRAAWVWAIDREAFGPVARSTHALWLFHVLQGRMREGRRMFGLVVDALGGRDDVTDRDQRLALANALLHCGGYQCGLGDFRGGGELLERGIAALRALDAPRDLALGLNFLAAMVHFTGPLSRERQLLDASLALFRQANDAWGAGYSLNDLGMVAHASGGDDLAIRLCAESLAIFREAGERRGMAFALGNLATFTARAGGLDEARAYARESLGLRRAGGDQWGIAVSLAQLGGLSRRAGDLDDAESRLIEALAIAKDGAFLPISMEILSEIAALRLAQRHATDAVEMLSAIVGHPAAGDRIRNDARDQLSMLQPVACGPAGRGAGPTSPGRSLDAVLASLLSERSLSHRLREG